ncbi:hypothetical protein DPMN_021275 [Dreissena polymorpha]|uniref:Uncharacterized protein n=1 Tax=Dreissena polymorpha TaxID=45954 RepID=A0A9D4S9U1_DREPO|nr:hypothetical protein DPMN_021275 [Dreissena polymorpha]
MALVSLPVIFLQMLAARAVDEGGSSMITVFRPVQYTGSQYNIQGASTIYREPVQYTGSQYNIQGASTICREPVQYTGSQGRG